MTIDVTRRTFLRVDAAGAAGTALSAFGFGGIEAAHADAIRAFKLTGTTETRNTCPYCSVACGVIMYSKGDLAKGEKAEIRRTKPQIRRAGAHKFEDISWDEALGRVARHLKDDRDANFVAQNQDG